MKLIVAVVRDEYAAQLADSLMAGGIGATKLASTGGFLKAGNSTFLVGVEAGQVEQVLAIIQAACPAKKTIRGDVPFADANLAGPGANTRDALPREVTVGGATVFVLPVESWHKI